MKTILFATTLATFIITNAQADTVGLYLGGQIWQSDTNGIFGEQNTLIDVNLEKEQQINYFVAVEHPFPWLPNIRISKTTLDTAGKTTLTQSINFGNEVFSVDDDVKASFNVNYIDYTLYYELFDNGIFSIDSGLTARDFNGNVRVTGAAIIDDGCNDPNPSPDSPCIEDGQAILIGKIKINDIEPMLYVASNISLPITGISIFAQGDFLFVGEHSFSDYQIGLSYELSDSKMMDFNLTLGYRAVKMEFEDLNNLYTDLEFKGAFVGVVARF